MKLALITLFPDVIESFKDYGVTGRAVAEKKIDLQCFNPRDYATDKHRTVDDRPYGGGPGMVMRCEPLTAAVQMAKSWTEENARVVYLSPQGKRLVQVRTQELAEIAEEQNLILIAGRYEGIDQRAIDNLVDEEISIGDYVLSGGELPALVLIDAILRHVPGVLGHAESAGQDSFSESTEGGLDWPHYTRPEVFEGQAVPDVLLSGDHKKIEKWRSQQAKTKTRKMRPDLILNRQN
ncbi:MAG: tRNA (guanosine(37)-N1)-methyltransferase TrmD [Porticoccaceae bacterium]|jgi:tRNA (guanine37-N1)-methyltransferase|nr:tRNA (guanosine(37)-N1)-methyltransferase TrmD [Porticoccaceae bacterium]